MNIGSHIAVADRLHRRQLNAGPADPGELLGSALPDVASMGRFRLLGRTPHRAVARGIGLHHRTDDLFHRHPWFQDHQRDLMANLGRAGFLRGPAMACAHVGVELLLDGVALAEPTVASAVSAAFDAIGGLQAALAPLVDPSQQPRWFSHLDRFAGQPPLLHLDDPEQVAARLFRILAARPRLAFPPALLPQLAAALDRRLPAVAAAGAALIEELVDQLEADPAISFSWSA
jgi:hypothetical protein